MLQSLYTTAVPTSSSTTACSRSPLEPDPAARAGSSPAATALQLPQRSHGRLRVSGAGR